MIADRKEAALVKITSLSQETHNPAALHQKLSHTLGNFQYGSFACSPPLCSHLSHTMDTVCRVCGVHAHAFLSRPSPLLTLKPVLITHRLSDRLSLYGLRHVPRLCLRLLFTAPVFSWLVRGTGSREFTVVHRVRQRQQRTLCTRRWP